MAHHSATIKSIRQIAKRTERNRALRSRVRTSVKAVLKAIAANDNNLAQEKYAVAQKELDKSITKGVFKKSTVARTKSRLVAKLKAIGVKGGLKKTEAKKAAPAKKASAKKPAAKKEEFK